MKVQSQLRSLLFQIDPNAGKTIIQYRLSLAFIFEPVFRLYQRRKHSFSWNPYIYVSLSYPDQ